MFIECGWNTEVNEQSERHTLWWFGSIKKMNEDRTSKRTYTIKEKWILKEIKKIWGT